MGKLTILTGLAMIALGVAAYVLSGFVSVTALIPAFFGVPIAFCGVALLRPKRVLFAGVAALLFALIGLGGTLSRLVPAIIDGSLDLNLAAYVQIVFTVLALAYLIGGTAMLVRRGQTPRVEPDRTANPPG